MKDRLKYIPLGILVTTVLLSILVLMLMWILYDNTTTRNTNEKLRRELYEAKQKINKLEDEKLRYIIKCNN